MRKLKLLFTAAIALVAFAALSTSAGAATAEIDPAGAIASESNGRLTFGSSPTIQCNVTLNGTLASSVELSVGRRLGEVTEVRIRECAGGSVSAILSPPWEMTISAILGTAPDNLTGLLFAIDGAAFNLSVFGGFVNCLYIGDAGALLNAVDTGRNTYSTGTIDALEEVQLPRGGGGGLCPDEGGFAGEFDVTSQRIVVS
jgi:hypothetical protein